MPFNGHPHVWDHPTADHRSVSQLPGHRTVRGGTFCPRSSDDVEMGDQQANAIKANVISTFWVVILVQKIKQGVGGVAVSSRFFFGMYVKALIPR